MSFFLKLKNKIKMFEYSKTDKEVYFVLFLWLSLSFALGWFFSQKMEAPYIVKSLYSTYRKFMGDEGYNFFCFNAIFIMIFMPFVGWWIYNKNLIKSAMYYGRVFLFLLFFLFFILFAFGLIEISRNNNSRGGGLVKIFLEFGAEGVTLFFFIMISGSLVGMIMVATAEKLR